MICGTRMCLRGGGAAGKVECGEFCAVLPSLIQTIRRPAMTFTQEAWARNSALFQATLEMPFNRELADGTL